MTKIDNGWRNEDHCPSCNCSLNGCVDLNEPMAKPNPGDFTVCINCAAALEFAEDLSLIMCDMNKRTLDEARSIHYLQSAIIISKKEHAKC